MQDHEIAYWIEKETWRQQNHLELIASENFVSLDVLSAQGSVLTNKYAEGYPGRRYYGGCFAVDEIEKLAIQRACSLFRCRFANVQPHSGSQANQAVFLSVLSPGDCILSLDLRAGGHLSHGAPVNISGKWFRVVSYGVDPVTHRIDEAVVRELAFQHRPKLLIAGASAYPRFINFAFFRALADEIGAIFMADIAHIAGLVVSNQHPSPFPHAHVVTTTTHKTLRGPRGGLILCNEPDLAKRIDSAIFPGLQGGPLMHVIAAKAVCFKEAMGAEFQNYGHRIVKNAKALAHALMAQGIELIAKGTDTHLLLVDLRMHALSGRQAEALLEEVHITCNKNGIPQDPRSAVHTSGLRLGTPAITTRGLEEHHMEIIATCITQRLHDPENSSLTQSIRDQVLALCKAHPLPYN